MDTAPLDALVAEKVMGWTVEGADYPYYAHYRTPDDVFVPNPVQPGDALRVRNWHPTTDIAQAWQVVERMVELGWTVELYSPGAQRMEWAEPFERWAVALNAPSDWALEEGDTAPLAICLAALQAVGVEVD